MRISDWSSDVCSSDLLLNMGAASGKSFAEMMLENELAHRSLEEVEAGLDAIAAAMDASIDAGCSSTGVLPGGLKVKRRAPPIAADIRSRHEANLSEDRKSTRLNSSH